MAIPAQRLPWRTPSPGWHSPGAAAWPVYRPRHSAASPLYAVVQHHLETFLARAAEADPVGYGVPTWVEKDFRAYLRCGMTYASLRRASGTPLPVTGQHLGRRVLAYGFARARCEDCGHERLIPFSCKGRGTCPSCNARRMAELAAHLTDHVLPHLPVRQWVLSVPKRLRPYLHHNPEVAGAVLGIFLLPIRTTLRRTGPGASPGAQLGAVSFLHRFGSSLNPHFHFYLVVLDGVFDKAPDGTVRFHEATRLTPDDWLALQRLVLRHFRTRGLLEEHDAVGMLSWQGSGGFSINAAVRIEGEDRAGMERLLRYRARPPFALERLHALAGIPSLASPQARLLYRFARPTPDGRTEIALSPLQLLEHQAPLARSATSPTPSCCQPCPAPTRTLPCILARRLRWISYPFRRRAGAPRGRAEKDGAVGTAGLVGAEPPPPPRRDTQIALPGAERLAQSERRRGSPVTAASLSGPSSVVLGAVAAPSR